MDMKMLQLFSMFASWGVELKDGLFYLSANTHSQIIFIK